MEAKTKIHAEEDRQEVLITRDFELPVDLLFKAYTEAELVEQWMGTTVHKLESSKHGAYHFETTDPKGSKHVFSGTIHDLVLNEKITRTFEMEGTAFPPQLEFLEFQELSEESSRLIMKIVYKSLADRDNMLKLPFAFGINMAHDRLQEIVRKLM